MRPAAAVATAVVAALMLGASGVDAAGSDWTTFMGGRARTGYNAGETRITPSTIPGLTVAWTAHADPLGSPAAASIFSQPIVSSSLGLVFWGSFNGYEYATRIADGKLAWKAFLGQTTDTSCGPPTVGVVSTATLVNNMTVGSYVGPVLFVGGGDANVYALAATTIGNVVGGTVLWSYSTGTPPASFVWSSPAYYLGNLYIGTSSDCDQPLVQGKLLQLNATSGTLAHEFDVVPNGCIGGSVWSSPAIDSRGTGNGGNPTVYFSTGNPGTCAGPEPYAEAIVEVSASDVSLAIGSWSVPLAQRGGDTDFGATPTIQDFSVNGTSYRRVGLVNKNGLYYEFTRGKLGSGPVWQKRIGARGGPTSSAFDGKRLYVGGRSTTINGTSCVGSISAVNPVTGAFIWRHCLTSGPVIGEVMASPGVAVVGEGKYLLAVSTATGGRLFRYTDASYTFVSTATIAGGSLYIGDTGGNLFAFR